MKNLNQFKKAPAQNLITTSIKIEPNQKAFIDENNLNLSMLVRDLIERLKNQKMTADKAREGA